MPPHLELYCLAWPDHKGVWKLSYHLLVKHSEGSQSVSRCGLRKFWVYDFQP